jgi:hypothetical protein
MNGLMVIVEFVTGMQLDASEQWYSAIFVRVPPDIMYFELCTPKVVGA